MENITILLAVVDVLFGIALYFMKDAYSRVKEDIKKQQLEIEVLREAAHKKEDFKEFKVELWMRLDKMEADFRRALDKHGPI